MRLRIIKLAITNILATLALVACSVSISNVTPTITPTVPDPVVRVELPSTSTHVPTESPPTATPTITPSPTPERIEGLPIIQPPELLQEHLSDESIPWFKFEIAEDYREPIIGETLTKTLTLLDTPAFMWDSWWCAANDSILANTLGNMTFDYILDGISLDPETQGYRFDQYQNDGSSCQVTVFYLTDWPSGTHTLEYTFTVINRINDGYRGFPPSPYPTIYTVIVP